VTKLKNSSKYKELATIISQLRVYLQENREEDFWQFKEILVNKNQKIRLGKVDFEKTDLKKQTLKADQKSGLEKELNALYKKIKNCRNCSLSKTRINLVFGNGSSESKIMFIGEAPGYDEDRQGLPFVGKAGQLLNEILESVGLERKKVYIANVVKCHPLLDLECPEKRGNDRPPTKEEIAVCLPILREQINLIKPRIICTLGAVAMNALLGINVPLSKAHGKFYPFRVNLQGEPYGEIKLLPTFHPAAILRTPSLKNIFINDLKKVCNVASSDILIGVPPKRRATCR